MKKLMEWVTTGELKFIDSVLHYEWIRWTCDDYMETEWRPVPTVTT